MGRKKSTDDKKRDVRASVTLETVSPSVEGSSDNLHTGSGASIGKSQSETLSQSEKSLGEKYRENRENLLSDTHRSKGATPDQSSSLVTTVSMDLRVDKSPVSSLHQSNRHQSTSHQSTRHWSPFDQAPVTSQRSFTRSPDIRSPILRKTI